MSSWSGAPAGDRDELFFMLAARWADDIRTKDQSQHRGTWHYVNWPFKPEGQPDSVRVKQPGKVNILTALRCVPTEFSEDDAEIATTAGAIEVEVAGHQGSGRTNRRFRIGVFPTGVKELTMLGITADFQHGLGNAGENLPFSQASAT